MGTLSAAEQGRLKTDAAVVCLATIVEFKDLIAINRIVRDVDCPLLDLENLSAAKPTERRTCPS